MNRKGEDEKLPKLDKLFNDGEDDQDFAPIAGSNLSAIFGRPNRLSDASTYFVKSSNNRQQLSQSHSKTEVIMAKVVHAYKLENGNYLLIGKLGLALVGNIATRTYQIILYRTKQEHISTVTIRPEFSYTIQENNYATYYDCNHENWSLLFENQTSCIEFAREVGISKYHSRQTKTDDFVFYQNLNSPPETRCAKENDEIFVKSIIFLNLSQPLKFDGSSMQELNVKIPQYDSWEKNLINCVKGLKRLLILPPSKQISLGPGFPKETDVMMEIEILDIIEAEMKGPLSKTSGKASILSRMAKMGQSILPKVPTSPTDSEDTEEELHVKSPRRCKQLDNTSVTHASKNQVRTFQELIQDSVSVEKVASSRSVVPTKLPLPHRSKIPSPVGASYPSSSWPIVTPIQQPYIAMDGQYYAIPQTPIAQPIPIGIDPNMNVFLSETRTQNTEIRMGISKIADNVQKILDKFHILEVEIASSPMPTRRSMHHSVDRMTSQCKKNSEITPNFVVDDRFEDDTRTNEEQKKKFESELNQVRVTLEEREARCNELNFEKQEWLREKKELQRKIEDLERCALENKNTLKSANSKIASSNDVQTNSLYQRSAEIKKLMNNTYLMLLDQFTDEETYTADRVKETLTVCMRKITFFVLRNLHRDEAKSMMSSDIDQDSESAKDNKSFSQAASVPKTLPVIPDAHNDPPPVPPIDKDDW